MAAKKSRPLRPSNGWFGSCNCGRTDGSHDKSCTRAVSEFRPGGADLIDEAAMEIYPPRS